ncbi:hypothetical protein ACVIHF_000967 [Bradyrhizobium sp. USDA 4506]
MSRVEEFDHRGPIAPAHERIDRRQAVFVFEVAGLRRPIFRAGAHHRGGDRLLVREEWHPIGHLIRFASGRAFLSAEKPTTVELEGSRRRAPLDEVAEVLLGEASPWARPAAAHSDVCELTVVHQVVQLLHRDREPLGRFLRR